MVSLPAAASPAAWVRCPLCRSEYRLHDALDFVPPALEIILPPRQSSDSHHAVPAVAAVPLRAPGAMAGAPQIPDLLTEPGRESATQPQQDLIEGGDEYQLQPAEPDPMPPPLRTPVAKTPSAAAPANQAATATENLDEPWLNADAANTKHGSRRRKKPKNPLVEIIKIAVGGLAGLAIGNAILFWGLKIDLLDLKKHLPDFMIPDGLRSADPTSNNETPQRPIASARPAAEPEFLAGGNQQARNGVPTSIAAAPFESAVPSESATRPKLPPLVEPEPAKPAASTEAEVGPKCEASFTLADVTQAMHTATDAAKTLDDAEISAAEKPDEYKNLRKQYYIALAKLAETVTLVRPQADDGQIARDGAAALVQNLANTRVKMEDLGTLSAAWRKLDHPQDSSGIVFFGELEQVETLEKQFRLIVKPIGLDTAIPIYSSSKPEQSPGGLVAVMGLIVQNPQTELRHFSGPGDPTIWAGVVASCAD
jgi:hypothetical protein